MTGRLLLLLTSVALIVAGFLVGGCSDPPPVVGEVTEHRYDDADVWTSTYMQCVAYGDDAICDIYFPIETTHYEDERWLLHLDDGERSGWTEVDRQTYNEVRDGQRFNRETGQVELADARPGRVLG